MKQHPTIFIVDDDAGVRDSLSLLLGLRGFRVQPFADASSFLAAYDPRWHGCALIDVRMPEMGGLELQQQMRTRHMDLPLILMTAHANVAAARTAFKAGAIDFLVKPIPELELLEAIDAALHRDSGQASGQAPGEAETSSTQLLAKLTAREHEVLLLLANGLTSKQAAERLGISHRTVETYKERMMKKLDARKLADLVRLATIAQSSAKMS